MTYPSSDADTSPLDAGTDSPAAARPSLLDLAQKFNLLRSHISTWMQGFLAQTSAATARAELGASSIGDALFTAANEAEARTAIGALGSVPAGSVDTTQLAALGVTTEKLADSSVTAAKLVDGGITSAKMAFGSVGVAQTWQDLTLSRSYDTNYTNSTTGPITLRITVNGITGSSEIFVDGQGLGSEAIGGAVGYQLTHIATVQPGKTYKFVSGTTLIKWMELRS